MRATNKMTVELLDRMGDDLAVVNAARVSFDKESRELSDRDTSLIAFLAREGHWTPFGHTAVKLRIRAPIFVARQLAKHQVGLVWNEVSRRYVDSEPEFYAPKIWRRRAPNVKQGSAEECISFVKVRDFLSNNSTIVDAYEAFLRAAADQYNTLIEKGVCPEQARMILPQSMMTEWIWTGNVAAFARVCNLRLDPHAQAETREVAAKVSALIEPLFPHSWAALVGLRFEE